ncbi:MAG: DUF2934 domain-containing protein [Terrimicrobiaceae bacterium]
MEALRQALGHVAKNGQALTAVIVDDELDAVGIPSHAEWIFLRDTFQSAPAFHDDFQERLVSMGHNPEDAPPIATVLNVLKQLRGIPEGEIQQAVETYTQSEHLLQRMDRCLRDYGFEVESFAGRPSFEGRELPYLCLVDYQLLPGEEGGDTAATIFADLMERAGAKQAPPPFVILMSKALTDDDITKWSNLAERAGFFRFNYGFLNKERFLSDAAYLLFPILHFVRHQKLSSAYYRQMSSLVEEAHGIAKQISRQLFQVSPPEALLFKSKVSKDGSTLSEELSDLFAALFSKAIKLSTNVALRMAEVENVIEEEGIPVPYRQQRSALHQLYAELLHQACDKEESAPAFGDIFEDADGRFFLVLSQECDITKGEERSAKVDRVIAVEGELKSTIPPKDSSEMIVEKPVFFAESDQRLWLWWNLGKPVVFPIQQFDDATVFEQNIATRAHYISESRHRAGQPSHATQNWLEAEQQLRAEWQAKGFAFERRNWKKKWRLRFADAEDIQHRFATRITRVALNVMPEFIHVHRLRLSRNESVIDEAPSIFIYEVQSEDKKKVSLAPESLAPCIAIDRGKFMSHALIEKLSKFIPLSEFNKELKRENLMVVKIRDDLLLAKATREFERGKSPWAGLGSGEPS